MQINPPHKACQLMRSVNYFDLPRQVADDLPERPTTLKTMGPISWRRVLRKSHPETTLSSWLRIFCVLSQLQ